MADSNLNEFNIDDNMYTSNTIDFSSMFTGSLIGVGSTATETMKLEIAPEYNDTNSFATALVYYNFERNLLSSDSWPSGFSSNDNVVFKKYVEQYKEKTGINLYDLSDYSFDELIQKGVFDSGGNLIMDSELVKKIMKDEGFNNYFESGYGVDVFCAWARDKASISFDEKTTLMNVKLSDITDVSKYVGSDDENNELATDESDAIIQTTNEIFSSMVPGYGQALNEYLKDKPISEIIGEDGKMHIDEADFKQFILKYNKEHPDKTFFGDEYSVTKQTHALVLGVNSLDIKYDAITEDRHINGTFGDLYNEEHKFSDASDLDQIYLNCFNNDLTNGVKEKFGRDSNQYKVYCKFLEGKKVNDIIKDGHFVASKEDLIAAAETAGVTLTDKELYDMLQYFSSTNVGQYSDSATLRNLTIQKVISEESGYDSIIFEKDGEVIITNTCADGESHEDTAAIGYSAIKLLCGGNTELYDLLAPAFTGSREIAPGLLNYGDIKNAGAYYDGQIVQSYANVISQLKAGKKVHINCYSLGGGTGFDTFMRIMSDDNIPEEYKSRLSISGFNPFFNIFEADTFFDDKGGHEAVIKKVFDNYGDQIDLRCIEGDVVSQFNTVIDGELGKHITYIKPSDNSPAELSAFDNDIMKLIVDPSSRHSLGSMNENSFCNGYLLENGQRMTLNEILGNDEPSNDLKVIYKGLVSPYFEDLKKQNGEYAGVIDAIDKYLSENVGTNINYDDIITAISPAIADLVEDKVPGELSKKFRGKAPDLSGYDFSNGWHVLGFIFEFGWWGVKGKAGEAVGNLANLANDNERLTSFIKNYYSSDDGKEKIKEMLTILSSGDTNSGDKVMGKLIDELTSLYIASLVVSIID